MIEIQNTDRFDYKVVRASVGTDCVECNALYFKILSSIVSNMANRMYFSKLLLHLQYSNNARPRASKKSKHDHEEYS